MLLGESRMPKKDIETSQRAQQGTTWAAWQELLRRGQDLGPWCPTKVPFEGLSSSWLGILWIPLIPKSPWPQVGEKWLSGQKLETRSGWSYPLTTGLPILSAELNVSSPEGFFLWFPFYVQDRRCLGAQVKIRLYNLLMCCPSKCKVFFNLALPEGCFTACANITLQKYN